MRQFLAKPVRSWLILGLLAVYLGLCWVVYAVCVNPLFGASQTFSVTADSDAYFQAAGLDSGDGGAPDSGIGLGGSVIGPVMVATVFRNSFGVAVFNIALFFITIQVAASVPGLQKRTFAALLLLDALTLPALVTLNKEILAIAGLAFFAKYIYSKHRPWWVLGLTLLFSTMARWQQTAFIIVYLVLQSRHSPFRLRPKAGIVALLLFISTTWALIAARYANLIAAYLALQKEISTGTVARLNAIQGKGGFFLVVWPKILMNLSGRLIQPDYYTGGWTESDFHDLQNTVIGNLHSIALLALLAVMLYQKRFRMGRPLVHFALIYFILTAVSPLIQNRYEYPAYALLAMEMARRKEMLEPVEDLHLLPPLTPSYRSLQA